MALSATNQEVLWLRTLEGQLNLMEKQSLTLIYCDNQSAFHLASAKEYMARSKHIDVRHHFLCEKKQNNVIDFKGVATKLMVADF